MDTQQFARLQKAVQWAVDEHLIESNLMPRKGEQTKRWDQDTWGQASYTRERVEVVHHDDYHAIHNWNLVQVDCGTTCCIAGNVVLDAGAKFVIPDRDFLTPGERVGVEYCLTQDSKIKLIPDLARELLGVDDEEGLFSGSNDIYEVIEYAEELASSHGHTLVLERLDLLTDSKVGV